LAVEQVAVHPFSIWDMIYSYSMMDCNRVGGNQSIRTYANRNGPQKMVEMGLGLCWLAN